MYPVNSKAYQHRHKTYTHAQVFAQKHGSEAQVKSAQHGFSELLDSPTAERCKYSTSQFVLGGIKFYCLANLPEQQGKHTMNKWRTVGNIIELCLNH